MLLQTSLDTPMPTGYKPHVWSLMKISAFLQNSLKKRYSISVMVVKFISKFLYTPVLKSNGTFMCNVLP